MLQPLRVAFARSFHAHVFKNGTPCDLTGGARTTEVRFVCAPEAGAASTAALPQPSEALPLHYIESVKEPTTCHYVLTFATPLMCKHAAFRVEEAPVSHIRCRRQADDVVAGAHVGAAAAEPSVAAAGSLNEGEQHTHQAGAGRDGSGEAHTGNGRDNTEL